MTIEEAKAYINRIDKMSDEQKKLNKRTVDDAMELSAWVSVAEYGSPDWKKWAIKQIKSIQ